MPGMLKLMAVQLRADLRTGHAAAGEALPRKDSA